MASNKPSSLGIKLSNKMTLSGHKAPITCLSVNPSESLLASGSEVRHHTHLRRKPLLGIEHSLTHLFASAFQG